MSHKEKCSCPDHGSILAQKSNGTWLLVAGDGYFDPDARYQNPGPMNVRAYQVDYCPWTGLPLDTTPPQEESA